MANDSLDDLFDIGIVGGGPAGLSAGIWAARYGHRVVLIDSGDPRNWETRGINGFLGFPGIRPPELRGRGRDELREYGVRLIDAVVERIEQHDAEDVIDETPGDTTRLERAFDGVVDDLFVIHILGSPPVRARRVLIASGIRDEWPKIPGLAQAYGANAHVCPDCDGYGTRDKRVAVIGHGRRSVGMALALTTWTDRITITTNGEDADLDEELAEQLAANSIGVVTTPITKLDCVGSDISRLVMADGSGIDVDKVFFTLSQYAADDLDLQLGCDRDEGGHIIVSEHQSTSVRSVFAAGDVTPGAQIAIRAASGGAVAAMAMHRSLLPAHRKLAPHHGAQASH